VRAENENGDVALAYDAAGRLVAEDQNGQVVRYERDATGLLTAIIRPDGRRIAFERDGDGRIADILDWLGERTRIA
jgi:YD repeat-containing protein